MTNYNNGNWWGWNGGECPVHPETVVEVVFEDGWKDANSKAHQWLWDHNGYSIIAFRVVKEHKEPREFWLTPNGGVVPKGMLMAFGWTPEQCTKYREVIE